MLYEFSWQRNWLEGKVVGRSGAGGCRRSGRGSGKGGASTLAGTILVGDDGPSVSYVNKKRETCKSVGIASFHIEIPASAGQADLLAAYGTLTTAPMSMLISFSTRCPAVSISTRLPLRMNPG
ncbi:MAG: tetrahydrofolate dehydrogenase/cyclohydrolase catalytic domain-containing protein [Syntrophotaleaceae bacterium]